MKNLLHRRAVADDNRLARPLVCVQGLGFVGAAMAVAVANAKDANGDLCFDVVGIDLPTPEGTTRIESLNRGVFPFESGDPNLDRSVENAHMQGNFAATTDERWYGQASVVIVDVHCDVKYAEGRISADLDSFQNAIRAFGKVIQPGTLVVVETTVPPGSCARVVAPTLEECFLNRGLPADSFLLAHSYERVMPGRDYYRSIVNFWRVFAGHTPIAADSCETFLKQVVNTREYPLTRLGSTTASETAKVLENTYRAVTIALIDEWGRFAEAVGIDLFEVVEAIRVRPTHSNMRQPGFGVGGYCLTKDPLFGKFAAQVLFSRPDLEFPYSMNAIQTNHHMPLWSVERLQQMLRGGLEGKKVLLLGVSYRPDVADTRYSPSATFVEEIEKRKAEVTCYDPIVTKWPEMDRVVEAQLPAAAGFDAVVFAVSNQTYQDLDLISWIGNGRPVVLDANNVLSKTQREALRAIGCEVESIGRGAGL